ncbi:MAG: ABC transporter permease subunit [Alphaproteobacteria bacterium]|nr:ABC transporter permease subunit [Alphaproteobacteria bacterium]
MLGTKHIEGHISIKEYATSGRIFRPFPLLVFVLFALPVGLGVIGAMLPALGYFPALGGNSFSLDYFHQFIAYPGVGRSIILTLWTGLVATILSFFLSQLICAVCMNRTWFRWVRRFLGPILSIPHISISLGLLYLIAPSGWIIRPFAILFGIDQQDWYYVPDAYGLALIWGLIIKEVPFLLLISMTALRQIPAHRSLRVARGFGYGEVAGWFTFILPQIYGRIRFPIWAVLVFSISVADMALVLIPVNQPTLSMLVLRWYSDADLNYQFLAAFGAIAQVLLTVLSIVLWIIFEKIGHQWLKYRIKDGIRNFLGEWGERLITALTHSLTFLVALCGTGSILILGLWSISGRWRFPDLIPSILSVRYWERHWDNLGHLMFNSLSIALVSSALSLVLVIGCLEAQQSFTASSGRKQNRKTGFTLLGMGGLKWWRMVIYLPLLLPQLAFLFGVQLLALSVGLDGMWFGVVWGHMLFVLPYMYLSLSGSFLDFDMRYVQAARALGKSPLEILFKIKLPMMLNPILVAFAVGVAVSIAQFLPTLFIGAGRVDTLTLEAVSLASGGDRRVAGVYAFIQAVLPFFAFAIAAVIPAWFYRNKSGMRGHR